jgi:hypothetical protein
MLTVMTTDHGGIILRGKPEIFREKKSHCHFILHNSMWFGLGSNPGRSCEGLLTNPLSNLGFQNCTLLKILFFPVLPSASLYPQRHCFEGFQASPAFLSGGCNIREIKSKSAMAKAAFNKKKALCTSKFDLNLRKKLVKCYNWSIYLYGAETWTLRKVDQQFLGSFEMWCWSWIDHGRSEEVFRRVKGERNIVQTIKRRKANWLGHILRRNCLLKYVIEGKTEGRIEMTGKRGRRSKQLLGGLKEKKGCYKLK